jgi:UDP-N-acetylglucosamine 1-carboxyvinyltransferase
MAKFIVEGGARLRGEVIPSGNKNEALPALCAALLTEETVVLENMPKIGDVLTMLEIFSSIGVEHGWNFNPLKGHILEINAKKLHSHRPDPKKCAHVRASILMLGGLLARLGKVSLPYPGGDVIGARRIDTHIEGARLYGAKVELLECIEAERLHPLTGVEIFCDEPSVTATENLLMLAAKAKGGSVLHNVASEPHVVGLCQMLAKMGAKISGIGSNVLRVEGTSDLGGVTHRIGSDFMEIGSFLCLGAVSGGEIKVSGIHLQDFRFIFKVFEKIGFKCRIELDSATAQPIEHVQRDVTGRIATIYSGPWPAFPTDLMSVAIVAASQAWGNLIFFEKMFEGRMFFTDKLLSMGANIVLCDPHRIVVSGRSKLKGAKMSSPDVRAGMAIVMASLIAEGKSEIDHIHQIERGYERIDEKLLSLGAKLKRIP